MKEDSIAERIIYLREQAGIERNKALADRLGVARQTIGQIMAGGKPSYMVLVKFKEEFDVDLNWLIMGEGEPPAPVRITKSHLNKLKEEKEIEKAREIEAIQMKAREEKMELKLKLAEAELSACKREVEYLKKMLPDGK